MAARAALAAARDDVLWAARELDLPGLTAALHRQVEMMPRPTRLAMRGMVLLVEELTKDLRSAVDRLAKLEGTKS